MNSSNQFSRRSFLKSTLAAGVAPMFLPSHLWSAETKPNDRIGVGFIGMGKMNDGHLGSFLGTGSTQVIAVCDVDTTRRNHAKKRVEDKYGKDANSTYKGCEAYSDFRELLARKDIDAVCIATPDHWHALAGIAAAKAGKDIYGEKPLTHNVHEAWALVKAVRDNNRVFQTGSQQRSSREFRVACELVRNGIIGKLTAVMVGIGGPGKACDLPEEAMEPGLNWDMWLGPAPMRPYNSVLSPRGVHTHFPNWRNYWEYGGGMVTDWGAHHFDIAQWGLGVDDSGPVEITPPSDAKATHGAKIRYADGTTIEHIKSDGVTFHGSDGMVFVSRGRFAFTYKGEDKGSVIGKDPKVPLGDVLDAVEKDFLADPKVKLYRSKNHKEDFLNAMKTRQKPICDVAVGATTVTTCHLVNQAYYNHATIKWDPVKHEFTGGTGKPAWLTREYRGEWKVA
jgi:predicted dehydrogenase